MKMRILFAAALGFTMLATPSLAADLKTLSCVRDSLTAAQRKSMLDSAGLVALQQATTLPEDVRAAIHSGALACKAKHGWSDEAVQSAEGSTLAELAYAGALVQARAKGVDEGKFLAALNGLTPAQRAGVLKQDSASLEAFVTALGANGVSLEDNNTAVMIGVLAAFKILQDNMRDAFVAA